MVSDGDRVSMHYVARLAEGEDAGAVVDTTDVDVALAEETYYGSRDYEPLVFEVGAGEVLPAIEAVVREMEPGETRDVVLDPADAFGQRSGDLVAEVPREVLEDESDVDATPGELVVTDDGRSGWTTDVSGDTATVDFNHELAGERLTFELRLLDVEEATAGARSGERPEPGPEE